MMAQLAEERAWMVEQQLKELEAATEAEAQRRVEAEERAWELHWDREGYIERTLNLENDLAKAHIAELQAKEDALFKNLEASQAQGQSIYADCWGQNAASAAHYYHQQAQEAAAKAAENEAASAVAEQARVQAEQRVAKARWGGAEAARAAEEEAIRAHNEYMRRRAAEEAARINEMEARAARVSAQDADSHRAIAEERRKQQEYAKIMADSESARARMLEANAITAAGNMQELAAEHANASALCRIQVQQARRDALKARIEEENALGQMFAAESVCVAAHHAALLAKNDSEAARVGEVKALDDAAWAKQMGEVSKQAEAMALAEKGEADAAAGRAWVEEQRADIAAQNAGSKAQAHAQIAEMEWSLKAKAEGEFQSTTQELNRVEMQLREAEAAVAENESLAQQAEAARALAQTESHWALARKTEADNASARCAAEIAASKDVESSAWAGVEVSQAAMERAEEDIARSRQNEAESALAVEKALRAAEAAFALEARNLAERDADEAMRAAAESEALRARVSEADAAAASRGFAVMAQAEAVRAEALDAVTKENQQVEKSTLEAAHRVATQPVI